MDRYRRNFLVGSVAAGGVSVFATMSAVAAATGGVFKTSDGEVTVFPVNHASFVLRSPVGTIYCDPVGDASRFADHPTADLILVTHEHQDHFNADLLLSLVGETTRIVANPAVFDMMPKVLQDLCTPISNGGATAFSGVTIDAIPAYNTSADRLKYHPKGRDNGYVLSFGGLRMYISGDTEDIPEMRALQNIDVAFLCMNLPFTMDINAAASAVAEFRPRYVFPYHYRGRDSGTQDPAEFAALVGESTEVKLVDWYG